MVLGHDNKSISDLDKSIQKKQTIFINIYGVHKLIVSEKINIFLFQTVH